MGQYLVPWALVEGLGPQAAVEQVQEAVVAVAVLEICGAVMEICGENLLQLARCRLDPPNKKQ